MQCSTEKQTTAYLTGDISKDEAARFSAHVDECEACRRRLVEMTEIRDGIGAGPEEFHDPTLKDEIMTLIDLGRGEKERLPRMARRRLLLKWAPVAAATAILPLILMLQLGRDPGTTTPMDDPSRFASRSAGPSADQWVSLELFHRRDIDGEATYQAVSKTLPTDAALAVAYEDRSEAPYPYLMVFAVTTEGETLWYYPEHATPEKNPKSIPIGATAGRVTLPDEVTHKLSPGPLRFFGVFSKAPITVREVNSEIKRQLKLTGDLIRVTRLNLKGTGQWTQRVTISPRGE